MAVAGFVAGLITVLCVVRVRCSAKPRVLVGLAPNELVRVGGTLRSAWALKGLRRRSLAPPRSCRGIGGGGFRLGIRGSDSSGIGFRLRCGGSCSGGIGGSLGIRGCFDILRAARRVGRGLRVCRGLVCDGLICDGLVGRCLVGSRRRVGFRLCLVCVRLRLIRLRLIRLRFIRFRFIRGSLACCCPVRRSPGRAGYLRDIASILCDAAKERDPETGEGIGAA